MENDTQPQKRSRALPLSIVTAAVILAFAWIYTTGLKAGPQAISDRAASIEDKISPKSGTILPIKWGELGRKLIEAGVIDEAKFKTLYQDLEWIHDENLILTE